MNGKLFLRDKYVALISVAFFAIFLYLFGLAFRVKKEYMAALLFLLVMLVVTNLLLEYYKKRNFYQDFLEKLEGLDQKYLITEMLREPDFMDAKIWCDALYGIDKSMKEFLNDLEYKQSDFKEYVEIWIHEVKVPIATLSCMNYNENSDLEAQRQQIDKIRFYVEQILFLSRADHPQKDYLMKKTSLEKLVNQVIRGNKELLISNQIRIETKELDVVVVTDAKWMEFILGQVINNSVKYMKKSIRELREEEDGPRNNISLEGRRIQFEAIKQEHQIELVITDDGIGISEQDIPRVFEKTFTGENGRKVTGSTGMGLYICQKLCRKMGHRIWLESQEGEYTKVHIAFGMDNYYCV